MNFARGLVARTRDDERGFTLIELMVVVLIIAILIAIAIPTFLGARERAQNRAAQSNLRNALTAEKTYYTDNQTYGDAATLSASNIETSLKWGAITAPTNADVDVTLSTGNAGVCLTAHSKSGKDFAIADISTGVDAGTYYNKVDGACPGGGWAATKAALGANFQTGGF